MTELLKTNPIALRHCLLYEFLQGKPIEESFSDFCDVVGDNAIKEESFKFWFDKFEHGLFDDIIEPITDMRDVLRNDEYALRACILYESLKYKQLEKTIDKSYRFLKSPYCPRYSKDHEIVHSRSYSMYKNFRKVIGNDVMEYREFDYWFYQFLNGEFDLKLEREKDQIVYELSNMPIDIIGNIVEYLDMFDRLSLAKTSRSLHTFTEDRKLFHQTLELILERYRSSKIRFDEKHFRSYADWKETILDFKNITKNPKLQLHTLLINLSCFHGDPFEAEEHPLKPSTHQLNVKKLSFEGSSLESLLKILQCLKPGYLTTIDIVDVLRTDDALMEKIVESEQWKRAQYFSQGRLSVFTGPLRHLYHFKEFSVRYGGLSVEDIRGMKENLFKSPVLERCSLNLYLRVDESAFEQEFGEAVRERPNTFHHPIPNSNEYFEITLNEKKIEIARKMR
ncbi:hypothetical protein CAEBREN_18329 [Caenorhabditis brenneri]|uniref:F-box domain-containing protein n=1 Tax=Caenorhabditis brenneri TaxID=135651 RepID=G0NID1_CAEBE|nr:hypothetical protein CAEBREN_18329 [Caenorhabditis brenneri]